MREIKFRGKVFNIWVYGHYLPWHSVKDENGKDVYAQIFVDDGRHSKQNIVGAHTVGQYTGLKDKNGVEIYEGDIIEGYLGYSVFDRAYIEYDDELISFVATPALVEYDGSIYEIQNGTDIEVIGNIYDNPELLKGDKE